MSLGKVTRCDIMYIRAFNEGLNVGGRRSRDSLATAHQQGEDTGWRLGMKEGRGSHRGRNPHV